MGDLFDAGKSIISGTGDFLFGKDGAPGGIVDTTPSEFAALRPEVRDNILSLFEKLGSSDPSVTSQGPFTADLTDAERSVLDQFTKKAQAGGSQNVRDLFDQSIAGDFLSADSNPFLKDRIEASIRPVRQEFLNLLERDIPSRFKLQGQNTSPGESTAFDRIARRAQDDFLKNVGDISTNIQFENFNQERNRQFQAAEGIQAIDNQDLNNLQQALQANALPRLIEQRGLDQGLIEFNRRVDLLLQLIGVSGNLAQANPVSFEGTNPTSGAFGDIAKAVAAFKSKGEQNG